MHHTRDYAGRRLTSAAGFSVPEILTVMALGATLLGITLMTTRHGILAFKSNGASTDLRAQLHVMRETALTRQREVTIVFPTDSTNAIEFRQVNPGEDEDIEPGDRPLVGSVAFESSIVWQKRETDSEPEAWCSQDGSTLNGREDLRFNTQGQLIDADTREMVSGCLYLGNPTDEMTYRAISVFSATGRMVSYQWNGVAWARN